MDAEITIGVKSLMVNMINTIAKTLNMTVEAVIRDAFEEGITTALRRLHKCQVEDLVPCDDDPIFFECKICGKQKFMGVEIE